MTKAELRNIVRENLDAIIDSLNQALLGNSLDQLEETLARLGRNHELPHWFDSLERDHSLPNLDGKTIGSVIEMLLVSILENHTLKQHSIPPLKINPAKGIDIPDLDLGVKSPSENFCTSEPFFSAYERLLGNEHDAIILLTDYQTKKTTPPLKIQIIKWQYLYGHEIADKNLCSIAAKHREWLLKENETHLKKLIRFLSYINQMDWRAKKLLGIAQHMNNEKKVRSLIEQADTHFKKVNAAKKKKDDRLLPIEDLHAISNIKTISPISLGVIDALDNWVVEVHKDFARFPNENEWTRFKTSPLDGKIGMSLALQWRYNFGSIFRS